MTLPTGPQPAGVELTTIHVRRAVAGDEQSCGWIVEHFTPALLLQGEYRLRGVACRNDDVEDLVQDVWAITLPRLPHLSARNGRWTPVLVKFLSTTLLQRANYFLRRFLRDVTRKREAARTDGFDASSEASESPDETNGVSKRIADRELFALIREAIAHLGPRDREVVVLRGIEQLPNGEVARMLDLTPAAVTQRYRRALQHLRAALPRSVFAYIS